MSEFKAIYQLPSLEEHQEWACEQGCSNVKPMLFRHVYSESWDKDGNLIQQLAENYYTCGREHLLMVWDNITNDYVALSDKYYQENT